MWEPDEGNLSARGAAETRRHLSAIMTGTRRSPSICAHLSICVARKSGRRLAGSARVASTSASARMQDSLD